MAEHFCQYIVKWPMTQDDDTIRCDKPAAIKSNYQGLNGWTFQWLCADHYDHIQKFIEAIQDGISA